MPEQGTSVGGRRLAAELRRLREHAGLTGEEASERLGWSGSKLSRIELHRIGVKQADLRKLLALYGVDDGYRDELLALARESRQRGACRRRRRPASRKSRRMSTPRPKPSRYGTGNRRLFPGFSRRADYARAVRQPWRRMFPGPPGETDRWVEARLQRQQVLTREPPLQLSVVIDESVLRRRFGDRAVMRQQLAQLAECSELPNVEVRIYPLNGEHPFLATGAFSYMQFPQVHDVPLHDIVSVEHLEGAYDLEDEEQTYQYRVAFEYLLGQSLDAVQSRFLITATSQEEWA